MIKNIIFDIENVILNFDYKKELKEYTSDIQEQEFIYENIINSPEWLQYGLIGTGYITKEDAINIVQDRTNHINDSLISNFWNTYNDYAFVDERILNIILKLKNNNYKVYLLSNINPYTVDKIKESGLFEMVDGYVLSYIEHQIKPYTAIYSTLLKRYKLKAEECLFTDDNIKNTDTATKLGMYAEKVIPDDYESVIEVLQKVI